MLSIVFLSTDDVGLLFGFLIYLAPTLICFFAFMGTIPTNLWRWAVLIFPATAYCLASFFSLVLNSRMPLALYLIFGLLTLLWLIGISRVVAWVYREYVRIPRALTISIIAVTSLCGIFLLFKVLIPFFGKDYYASIFLSVIMIGFGSWGLYDLYKYVILSIFTVKKIPKKGKLITCKIYIEKGYRKWVKYRLVSFYDSNTYSVTPHIYKQMKEHIGEEYSYVICESLHGMQFLRQAPKLIEHKCN